MDFTVSLTRKKAIFQTLKKEPEKKIIEPILVVEENNIKSKDLKVEVTP